MIEKKEIDYAKELGDVMDLVVAVVKTIREKGDYTTLVSELVTAINGMDQIPSEFKEDTEAFINTVAIGVNQTVHIFLK